MLVVEGIDHGHRAGQSPFNGLRGLLTQKFGIVNKHRFLAAHRANHCWYTGIVAVANFYRFTFFKINAAEVFYKGGDKVLAGLLAITNNINAGQLLLLQ